MELPDHRPVIDQLHPSKRVYELIQLFGDKKELNGLFIIRNMDLASDSYHRQSIKGNTSLINLFFRYFIDNKILICNPGHELSSAYWADNSYAIDVTWKRDFILNKVLNN